MLPPENLNAHPDAVMAFFRILVTELNSSGAFEAVVADPDSLLSWGKPCVFEEGRFPEQMLVELRQRFQVDGVLFSSLIDIHPYWPQRLGLTMHLVDTYDASTAVSVSGRWNAEDGSIASQVRAAFSRSSVASSIGDVELALQSPHYFHEFVADQLSDRFVAIAQASMGMLDAAADTDAYSTADSQQTP